MERKHAMSSVVEGIKTNYLNYPHLKNLELPDLHTVRMEVVEDLTFLQNRIKDVEASYGNTRPLNAVLLNLKRILSTVNGIISSRNRVTQEKLIHVKAKLKKANILNKEQEAELGSLRRELKAAKEEIEEHKKSYKELVEVYIND